MRVMACVYFLLCDVRKDMALAELPRGAIDRGEYSSKLLDESQRIRDCWHAFLHCVHAPDDLISAYSAA